MKILVTDDNELTRKVMKKLLTRLGHSVDLAVNGQDCLEKLPAGGGMMF
jgi:CheY-like chemotaxis protein